jgi:hypothetical protein
MVVNDLDVARRRLVAGPLEANPPAIIDPDAVLTCSITNQRLKAVTWQHHEGSLVWCGFHDFQSLVCLTCERLKLADSLAGGKPSGALVPIPANAGQRTRIIARHGQIVASVTLYVKRKAAREGDAANA